MNVDQLQKTIHKIKLSFQVRTPSYDNLQLSIQQIRQAFISDWSERELPLVKILALCIQQGIPTPTVALCGRSTDEKLYTKYIAYYLNPNQNHGLGNRLLKRTFRELVKSVGWPEDWHNNCRVLSELPIGKHCRCDIVIVTKKFGVIIEHKVLSSESKHPDKSQKQLERYNKALSSDPAWKDKQILKIYLTPDCRNPSSAEWLCLSHADIVQAGLDVLNDKELAQSARYGLLAFLFDLAMGPIQIPMSVLRELRKTLFYLGHSGFNLKYINKLKSIEKHYPIIIKLLKECCS